MTNHSAALDGEGRLQAQRLADRITDYLGNGGFFNPEMMEHDKVRDLLMDARDFLLQRKQEAERDDLGKTATGCWHEGYDDGRSKARGYTSWEWDGHQLKTYDHQPTHWMPLPAPPVSPAQPKDQQ